MTVATAVAFTIWAFAHTGTNVNAFLLILAIAFGLFMAFNIGGNDVANSFGTSVGAGTLTMKQALVVAAVFEVSGAILAGSSVTETVRSGIVDIDGMHMDPRSFAFIMMAALLGGAVWLLLATRMGWPVSTTHSIIGGIVGAAVTTGIVDRHWRVRDGPVGRDRSDRRLLAALPAARRRDRVHPVRRDQASHPGTGRPGHRPGLARIRRRRGR